MKFPSIKATVICLVFAINFSCQSNTHDHNGQKGKASFSKDSSVLLKFEPLQALESSRYMYATENEMIINQEVDGNEVNSFSRTNVIASYDFERDKTNYKITITYKSFKAHMKAGELNNELDASTAINSSEPENKIFGALNNASFVAIVSEDGKVISLTGIEEIVAKMNSIANGNANAIRTIQSLGQQFLSKEIISKGIEENFKVMPSKAVKIGSTWAKETSIGSDFALSYPVKYTIYDIRNNKAVIQIEGNVDIQDQTAKVQGYPVTYGLKGNQKGNIEVDLSTGMSMNASSTFKAEGKMLMMGREIPMEIEVKTKVEGRKVER